MRSVLGQRVERLAIKGAELRGEEHFKAIEKFDNLLLVALGAAHTIWVRQKSVRKDSNRADGEILVVCEDTRSKVVLP